MKFGFEIAKTRVIELDDTSRERLAHLTELVPSHEVCIYCGACAATCSAGSFTSFNIRKIHTMFRRGQYENLSNELEKCMLCGKCTLVCPRGVNLRNLIIQMRKIVAQ